VKKKRHVVFVLPSLEVGGAERFAITLLKNLDRDLFRLSLVLLDSTSYPLSQEVPQDVSVYMLGFRRMRHALFRLILLLRKLQPDSVFSLQGHISLPLVVFRKFLPRKSLLVAHEASVVSYNIANGSNKRFWWLLYRVAYKNFNFIVSKSKMMRQDLIQNYGIRENQIITIFNPVDITELQLKALDPLIPGLADYTDYNIVAVGRLEPEKNYSLLLQAFAEISDVSCHLTLIGDGSLRYELEQLAKRLKIFDKVTFVGYKPNPYPYMKSADMLVLSSKFEGMPNVVLEALACGTPVAATPAPGGVFDIAKLAGGVNIATDHSATALAKAIKDVLTDLEFYRKQIDLSHFTLDSVLRSYEKLLYNGSILD
jgi:glycosyltransferase involved in cell wall biosynthesis